jgi:hypothetical protein
LFLTSKLNWTIAGVVILGLASVRFCGQDEKSKIQKVIQDATTEASASDETEGIQIQTKAIKVSRFMSPAFTAKMNLADGQIHSITSKQEFVSHMTAAIYLMKPLVVEVSGLDLTVLPGADQAEASLDLNLRHSANSPPFETAHFLLELKKIDGEWLIDRAEGEVQRP